MSLKFQLKTKSIFVANKINNPTSPKAIECDFHLVKGPTKSQTSSHVGHEYVNFVRSCSEQCQNIVDELYVNTLFEHWYDSQMNLINSWLLERVERNLSNYQLTCLSFVVKKLFSDFQLHGIEEEKIASKTYDKICRRIQLEETTTSLSDGSSSKSKFAIFNGFGK
uniref:MUN domain-containing protein n=1 Tax=Romanomermis culicivorax TaxID=13658 RepID=A0A915JI88_ROMCU